MIQNKIRQYLRSADLLNNADSLNILVIGSTHERYEQQLCKTGHNFFSINHGKQWDLNCGDIPKNYHIIDYIPHDLKPDLILTHVSGERLDIANEYARIFNVKVIRHTHTLPENDYELKVFRSQYADLNTFISEYSKNAWGLNNQKTDVITHGIDTSFFSDKNIERKNTVLSVVNKWASRDWACGWKLYQEIVNANKDKTFIVAGDNPDLSKPASSTKALVDLYNESSIFLNTSQFSPVPMALIEAMACGCAVVSSNTCMIPEIITHEFNGFLASTPDEFNKYLTLLYNNKELAEQIGSNARMTIFEHYNLINFCRSWDSIFRKTILS